jgi:hypothetical protein
MDCHACPPLEGRFNSVLGIVPTRVLLLLFSQSFGSIWSLKNEPQNNANGLLSASLIFSYYDTSKVEPMKAVLC